MTSLMHLPQKDTNTAYPTVAGLSNKYDVWKRWQTINRKPEKQTKHFLFAITSPNKMNGRVRWFAWNL